MERHLMAQQKKPHIIVDFNLLLSLSTHILKHILTSGRIECRVYPIDSS